MEDNKNNITGEVVSFISGSLRSNNDNVSTKESKDDS